MRKILALSSLLAFSTHSFASDFSLPFINASGLGNAYADWATSADDASTAYANPAGLTRLHHQQLTMAILGLTGNTKFTGTTVGFPSPPYLPEKGSASSRLGAIFPTIFYALPVNDRFTVALSQTTPFALGTNYPKDSIVRYFATNSKVVVVDIGPSVGMKLTDKLSAGLGFDANRLAFNLNNMIPLAGSVGPNATLTGIPDAESQNHLSGWGYGWHGGLLYEWKPTTRIGASFNSMVMFHTTGDSEIYIPFFPNTYRTKNQKSNAALPARAQFSVHHDLNPCLTLMGTAFYTNWRTFDKITMKRVMLPDGNTTSVTIPLNYRNTFDYSVGLNYKANTKLLLRTGLQFMNTPSNDTYRGVADPIGRGTIVAGGATYYYNPCLSYDFGVAHTFFQQEAVNIVNPLGRASGHNNIQSTVIGAQINWNIT